MTKRFAGLVPVGDDELLDVVLSLDDGNVELKATSGSIGLWDRKAFEIEYSGREAFILRVDGDVLPFSPRDFYSFKQAVDELFPTVEGRRRVRWMMVAGSVMAVAISAIILLNSGLLQASGSDSAVDSAPVTTLPPPAPVVVEASIPVTNAATSMIPVSQFVQGWNGAAKYRAPLAITGDPTSSFTHRIMNGLSLDVVAPLGGVETVELNASPTGDYDHDRIIVAAIGAFIAASDPRLDPAERRDLVEDLGLRLDKPFEAEIDGNIVRAGLTYSMTYRSGQLEFTIQSAS